MAELLYREGMRLLYFYFSLSLFVTGSPLEKKAEEALSQGRHEYAYQILSVEKDLPLNLALLYLEAGVLSNAEVDPAITILNEASDPEIVSKRNFWLAVRDLNKGQFGNALSKFNELYRDEKSIYRETVRQNLAKIHIGLGNPEESIRLILEGDVTESAYDRLIYAEALLAVGEFEKCKDVLESGLFEGNIGSHKILLLAKAYYLEGDFKQATRLLKDQENSNLSKVGRSSLSLLSLMLYEEGIEGGYDIMFSVLENATPEDPFRSYLDQLLLAAELKTVPNTQLKSDLATLREVWTNEMKPSLLFTIAQLEEDVFDQIDVLSEISSNYPDHSMSGKSSLLAAQLSLQIEDEEKRKGALQKILDSTRAKGVKAKIDASMAELSEGSEKVTFYSKALKNADEEQVQKLRLNYNLAQFYLPDKQQKILNLTQDQYPYFFFEKAMITYTDNPGLAEPHFEEFLKVADNDSRSGLAHLLLAEIKLAKNDLQLGNTIKEHLDTIDSVYLDDINKVYENRFYLARLKLAVLTKDVEMVQQFTKLEIENKVFLFESAKLLHDADFAEYASRQLKKLESLQLTPLEKDLSSFYLALSYLKLGTEEHQKRGVASLRAQTEGYLGKEVKLVLANYYLENADAQSSLDSLEGLQSDTRVNLLKARSYSLMGGQENQENVQKYYQKLLKDKSLPLLQRYQLAQQYSKFLEGTELFGEEVELYYQIVKFELLSEPQSDEGWSIFKALCDRAVSLMEGLGKWRSAYAFAKQVSNTNLPDNNYFTEKASEISLKHILWEER